jgi:hypothetical protein
MEHDNRIPQLELFELVCLASHGELLTAVIRLLTQCGREDLDKAAVPNGGMLHTTEIYNLLRESLGGRTL